MFPVKILEKVVTVMQVMDNSFDLAFEGEMFKTLQLVAKTRQTSENSPF